MPTVSLNPRIPVHQGSSKLFDPVVLTGFAVGDNPVHAHHVTFIESFHEVFFESPGFGKVSPVIELPKDLVQPESLDSTEVLLPREKELPVSALEEVFQGDFPVRYSFSFGVLQVVRIHLFSP